MLKLKDKRIITIIRLSQKAFRKFRFQIASLILLGFVTGALEGIGINAVVPLISSATKTQGGPVNDSISRTLEKIFDYFDVAFNPTTLLIFISLMFLFQALVLILCNYIKIRISADYEEQTRNNLFEKTINASWPYLSKQRLGYLETIIKIDIAQSATLLDTISAAIMVFTGLLIYTLVAINISLYITLFTFILAGILFLLFKPWLYKTRITAREVASINKKIAHHINEGILGIKSVKTAFVTEQIIKLGKKYFAILKQAKVRIFLLRNVTSALIQPISIIFASIIFIFVYKSPGFSFAVFIPIMYLIYRIFQYIQKMQENLHRINESLPYLKEVLVFERDAGKNKEILKGNQDFQFKNSLEFKNVSFSYGNTRKILKDLNFKIKRGEMVGLIGPSGVGKTTLVDLILRLFQPTQGQILVDGKDISHIAIKQWRRKIGYISQDIFLLNDTIANNIKFHDPKINSQTIERAAREANIYDFIQTLPKKFDASVGENGSFLSAGQRQRVTIARILARNPKFLILDEATSALDNESEMRIQEVIEGLRGKITILVIAHKLSTIINCNKLLALENGQIVEQGTPTELAQDKKSYFYRVHNIQKK